MRFITSMKILYFIFYNLVDLLLVMKEDVDFTALNTYDVFVNDDYRSYTTNTIALKSLWVVSEYLKQILQFDALKYFCSLS